MNKELKNRRRVLLALAGGLMMPHAVRADSLWKRCRRPQQAFLVSDSRARHPGDLITIIINESTEVQNRENKALNKSSNASGVFDLSGSTTRGAVTANLDIGKETDRGFSGDATYRNSREVADRITATVISVSDSGNLFVSGERTITVAGEKRVLCISGIIRPVDIGPDNTVSSRYVGNMETEFKGEGAEKHFTRQGWAGRFMNSVWPF